VAALAWLLIPLVGVLVAVVWARWAGRGRPTADGASLAGYQRFRTAMEPAAEPAEPVQPVELPPLLAKSEVGETDAEPV
jgi:hypothetical protein